MKAPLSYDDSTRKIQVAKFTLKINNTLFKNGWSLYYSLHFCSISALRTEFNYIVGISKVAFFSKRYHAAEKQKERM